MKKKNRKSSFCYHILQTFLFKLILSSKPNMSYSLKATLLLLIFFQCVFGSNNTKLECPETDFKLRNVGYLKLQEKSGDFCISCLFTRGGPVNNY